MLQARGTVFIQPWIHGDTEIAFALVRLQQLLRIAGPTINWRGAGVFLLLRPMHGFLLGGQKTPDQLRIAAANFPKLIGIEK